MLAELTLKLNNVKSMLRLRPFNVSTEEGRSNERHRRVFITSIASAAAKVIGIATSLISIPLTVNYLGTERYGMWVVASSIIAMMTIADFGLSKGVLNAVSRAKGELNEKNIRESISNGILLLGIVAVLLSLIFSVVYFLVPWSVVFNVNTELAKEESSQLGFVLIICFIALLPLGLVRDVQLGLQEGFVVRIWESIGSVLSLFGVLVAIWMELGLPWLALAIMSGSILSLAFNNVHFFLFSHREYTPNKIDLKRKVCKSLIKSGALFLVLQIAGLVSLQSDNIILTQLLGPEAVSVYAIVMKLFFLPAIITSFFLIPLWPAYGEAYRRGDILWIKSTFKKSIFISALINIPITLTFLFFGQMIIEVWVGQEVVPNFDLLVAMTIWSILTIFGGTFNSLFSGMHILKFQAISAALMAVANIFISIAFVDMLGIVGAVYGTILAFTIFTIIPYSIYSYFLFKNKMKIQSIFKYVGAKE